MKLKDLISNSETYVDKKVQVEGHLTNGATNGEFILVDKHHPEQYRIRLLSPNFIDKRQFLEIEEFWKQLPQTVQNKISATKAAEAYKSHYQQNNLNIFIDLEVDQYLSQFIEQKLRFNRYGIITKLRQILRDPSNSYLSLPSYATLAGNLRKEDSGLNLTECDFLHIGDDQYQVTIQDDNISLSNLQRAKDYENICNVSDVLSNFVDSDSQNIRLSGLMMGQGIRGLVTNFFVVPNYAYIHFDDPRFYGVYIESKRLENFVLNHEGWMHTGTRLDSNKQKKSYKSAHMNNVILKGQLQTSAQEDFQYEVCDISEVIFQTDKGVFQHNFI